MHDDTAKTMARLQRAVRERIAPATHRRLSSLEVAQWEVPGEPVPVDQALSAGYLPTEVGTAWGRPWGTVWFRLRGAVPAGVVDDRHSVELEIDLGFDGSTPGFQCEGLVHSSGGRIRKAVSPFNRFVPACPAPDGSVEVYVEAAANPNTDPDFTMTPTPLGDPDTAGTDPIYRTRAFDLVLRDAEVWDLLQDARAVEGLHGVLASDRRRTAQVTAAIADMLDVLDPDDVPGSAVAARAALRPALDVPASPSAHRVLAVGHAHIDSAWLWPARETVRKCARTFSNALALMDDHPEFVFAASSAQQYAWIERDYPELFERIRARVAEGRFVPVGGMWVESDTMMPGGEALARQLVQGVSYLRDAVGADSEMLWLPDSFGYSAQLPQLARLAGLRWFLGHKLAWNDTNDFPHHSFDWEGLDGSRVFTHFPPVGNYNSDLSAKQLDHAEREFRDHRHQSGSLVPFGWGDGGGGPTREILASGERFADTEGVPAVRFGAPAEFFAQAQAEARAAGGTPVWRGELYLELHRGVLSCQQELKRGNRHVEHLLREAELWAATAAVRVDEPYPAAELTAVWRELLLAQFHDVLTGTSIAWVNRDTRAAHARAIRTLEACVAQSLAALCGEGDVALVANARPGADRGVPALGIATPDTEADQARLSAQPGGLALDNGVVRVVVDGDGQIVSLVDALTGREAVRPGHRANTLELHRDIPNCWDAWDIDEHYRRTSTGPDASAVVRAEHRDDGPAVVVERSIGSSRVTQAITLPAGSASVVIDQEVDWSETQKLLKLGFVFDVETNVAASEVQFGHVRRAIHTNTSWDAARFETCAHRFVQVGEPGYGVAVANDGLYGHDVTRTDGGVSVRLTLARSPLYPDPSADRGVHRSRVSLTPGAGIAGAVAAGYALNLPERRLLGARAIEPLVTVSDDGAVVEAVKLAEDGSGDVVVRLYEARGTRRTATVAAQFEAGTPWVTDLLERSQSLPDGSTVRPGAATIVLRPFQIVSLRFPQ